MNAPSYLETMITENRLRWTFIRDKGRRKIGELVTFRDQYGDIWVGVSKVNPKDQFDRTTGLGLAILNALPVEEFLDLVKHHPEKLPKIPKCWRTIRDDKGYITNEVAWYDQYEQFTNKLERMLLSSNSTQI